jgi:integrase
MVGPSAIGAPYRITTSSPHLRMTASTSATPQKSWGSAWRTLRKAGGIPALRFHDLRHHAITELAESQASEATIMAITGHVSGRC